VYPSRRPSATPVVDYDGGRRPRVAPAAARPNCPRQPSGAPRSCTPPAEYPAPWPAPAAAPAPAAPPSRAASLTSPCRLPWPPPWPLPAQHRKAAPRGGPQPVAEARHADPCRAATTARCFVSASPKPARRLLRLPSFQVLASKTGHSRSCYEDVSAQDRLDLPSTCRKRTPALQQTRTYVNGAPSRRRRGRTRRRPRRCRVARYSYQVTVYRNRWTSYVASSNSCCSFTGRVC